MGDDEYLIYFLMRRFLDDYNYDKYSIYPRLHAYIFYIPIPLYQRTPIHICNNGYLNISEAKIVQL